MHCGKSILRKTKMGNDGGSIPTRRELVKEAARDPSTTQVKETQNEQQQYHWTTCPLSHQPLRAPIVSDSAGLLYSKDAVLEHLLESGVGQEADEPGNEEWFKTRVKGLRDLVEVKFQVEEETESKQTGVSSTLKWVCPITKKTLGPRVKAVYLVPCGHAFLEGAIKEMPGENCLQCNEPYTPENIIPILPSSTAEKERLKNRAQGFKDQGLTHSLKKAPGGGKKRKKNTLAEAPKLEGINNESNSTTQLEKSNVAPHGSIKNEGTAALTAKVLAEHEDQNKRRKIGGNENLKSLFSSKNRTAENRVDFMTRGFSISDEAKR